MIRAVISEDIPACVQVVRESFLTVAREFGITPQNAPRFTAFAVTEERLRWQLTQERRPMYGWFEGEALRGYDSLAPQGEGVWELNNLCVLPGCRHQKIGGRLLCHAMDTVRSLGCVRLTLGLVEENARLRAWYESLGFVHSHTKRFDFFPFTCGYMERAL